MPLKIWGHRFNVSLPRIALTGSITSEISHKQAVWPPGSADTVCPRPPLTLTFDRLTLKLVCESH